MGDGTYIAATYDKMSKAKIASFIRKHNIQNPCDIYDIHSTIVYSRKVIPNVEKLINSSVPMKRVKPTHLGLLGEGKCLVLFLDCKYLHKRHRFFVDGGATHDFPSYDPHITLSYNCRDFNLEIPWKDGDLYLDREFYNELEI